MSELRKILEVHKLEMVEIRFGDFIINIRYSSVIFRWLRRKEMNCLRTRINAQCTQKLKWSINVFIYAANCGIENDRTHTHTYSCTLLHWL